MSIDYALLVSPLLTLRTPVGPGPSIIVCGGVRASWPARKFGCLDHDPSRAEDTETSGRGGFDAPSLIG